MSDRMEVLDLPESVVAVSRFHVGAEEVPGIGERIGQAIGAVASRLEAGHAVPVGPPMARYHMVEDGFDVEVGFRVDAPEEPADLDLVRIGGCRAAHLTHQGPYSTLPQAYADLQQQAAEAGCAVDFHGPMWEEYWSPPGTPDAETRTEIYWPVGAGTDGP